jgi:P4 family phage/plasmid primase-like protien
MTKMTKMINWYNTKKMLLDNVIPDNKLLLSTDYCLENDSKQFTYFNNFEDYITFLENYKNNHFYEILYNDTEYPVYVYFDLDRELDITNDQNIIQDYKSYCKKLVNKTLLYFNKFIYEKYNFQNINFIIGNNIQTAYTPLNPNKPKLSIHIKINIIMDTIQDMKKLRNEFVDYLLTINEEDKSFFYYYKNSKIKDPFYNCIIDSSVYTNFRSFRLPYSSKITKNLQITPFMKSSKFIKDHLINIHTENTQDVIEIKFKFDKINEETKSVISINTVKPKKEEEKNNENTVDLNFVKDLVNILSQNRSENYDTWIKVGWCLHNIDKNLLDTWIEFSKQSRKFVSIDECNKFWPNMKNTGLNIGTLCMWAKEDDKYRYYQLLTKTHNISSDFKECKCTHLSIAKCIHLLLKEQFICDGVHWYYFNNHYWVNDIQNLRIKKELGTTIKQQFIYSLSLVCNENDNTTYDDNTTSTNKTTGKRKNILNIIYKLEDNSFKDKLLNELKLYLADTNFLNKIDSNKYLIGFENGVFDLEKNEFRNGKGEDYIMKTVGYDYIEENDTKVQQYIMNYFKSLFENEEEKEYLLKTIAYCLSGNKYLEEFFIWTGIARNGKGTSMYLIGKTFGSLYKEIDVKNLTDNSRKAGTAQSEIAQLHGIKLVSTSEPGSNDSLQVSKLKLWSGNDRIIARALYKESIEFYPQFAIFIQCNTIPALSKLDDGIAKRINITKFNYQFVSDPIHNNQRKIDNTIKERFETLEYKQQFMLILISYYNQFIKNNQIIHKPTNTLEVTNEYLDDNNVIKEWLLENYEITNNDKDRIKTTTLLEDYKNTGNNMSSSQLKHYLELLGITYKKTRESRVFTGLKKNNQFI